VFALLLNVESSSNDFSTSAAWQSWRESRERDRSALSRNPLPAYLQYARIDLRANSATSAAAEDPETVRTPAVGMLQGKGESQEEPEERPEDEPPEGGQILPLT
jgi:hypothetical protein